MKKSTLCLLWSTAFIAMMVLASSNSLATEYQIIDLGTLGGISGDSIATGINASGQVCGNSITPDGSTQAFIWDNVHGMRQLDRLPGATYSAATSINASGQIAGRTTLANGSWVAVRWDVDRTIHQLSMPIGYSLSHANDINDQGQVVGFCRVAPYDPNDRACLWASDGTLTDLGVYWGQGINNTGIISGVSSRWPWHGVTWDTQQGNIRQDIPGFANTYAHRINDLNHVIGNDETNALFWNGQQTSNIGSLTGGRTFTEGLNDIDQIVGFSYSLNGQNVLGWVWSQNTGFQQIGPLPGGNNSEIYDINNAGLMVGMSNGSGLPAGGHAVLVQPILPETIWPDTKTGITDSGPEGNDYELGTIFRSSIAGIISHARVYALPGETGEHTVRIWRNSDGLIVAGPYRWDYHGAIGWKSLDIVDIMIDANTDYTIAISTGDGDKRYPYIHGDLNSAGNNGAHLSYPENAGVFSTELGTRPTSSYQGSNYLRDVVFLDHPTPNSAELIVATGYWMVNGHRYSVVRADSSTALSLQTARERAALMGGYLASATSLEEGDLILNLVTEPLVSSQGGYLLGAEKVAGNWQWDTNEPFNCSNWLPGQPDNATGNETKLINSWSRAENRFGWEDIEDFRGRYYIVEWGNLDTSPPDTIITNPLSGSISLQQITFHFLGNDNLTRTGFYYYSWRLDDGVWSNWSKDETANLTNLSEGTHRFEVKTRDQAGYEDPSPAVDSFMVDITSPDTTIDSPLAASSLQLPVIFVWSGSDNSNLDDLLYSWRIDGGDWSAWDGVKQLQFDTLTVGHHTFEVKARDAVGNVDETPASITISVDLSAPDTEFTVAPTEGALLTVLPVNFAWSGSDDTTPQDQLLFSYRLDNGAWSAWSNLLSISISSLAEGYHTFEVKSQDLANREDETPAQSHFTLDISRPDTFFTAGAAEGATLNAMPQTYSFSGLDSVTPAGELQFSTRLDNAAWSPWSSDTSISIHVTKLGAHTLQVKARDLAGWEDSTPAVRHFILIDTLEPDTELTRVPGAMNKIPAVFIWQGSDNVTPSNKLKFSWRLNGGEWSPWSTSKVVQLSSLIETMPYTFEVRALDLAGLIDPTPATANFIIDTTPPDTAITYAPTNGALVNKPITFYWVGSDNLTASTDLTFSYRIDSGVWSSWSNVRSKTYPSLATGTHRFQVRAKDSAGNIDLTPDSRTFKPDNATPNTVILVGPASNSKVPLPVSFQWIATDNLTPSVNLLYSWRIDNGNWSPWSLSCYYTITSLTAGQHVFYVRARDISGNEESSPASRVFNILNPSALDTFIISGPAEGSSGQFPVTFSWSGVDDTTPVNQLKYSWRVSLGPWSTISSATIVTFNSLPWDGAHTFEVRGYDADGNVDATPALRHFSVDGISPNTYESWIQRQVIAGQPFTAYWSGSDNLTAATALNFRWRLDNTTWSEWSTSASTVLTLTHGSHTFEVQSRDAAGNVDATPLSVLIYAQ